MNTSQPANDSDVSLRSADGRPNVKLMADAITEVAGLAATEIDAMARDENTRFAWWTDQQDNGRKPDVVNGREASPWPQASDTRVRLADAIINYNVRIMKTSARRARLLVRGTESGDMRNAGKTQLYVDYLRNTKLRRLNARESEQAAQFRETYGKCLTAIIWNQEYAIDYVELSLQAVQQLAMGEQQQAQQEGRPGQHGGAYTSLLAQLGLDDPRAEAAAAETLRRLYPELDLSEAKAAVRELVTTGTTSLPERYLRINEARREALKLWRDVWLPTNTEDIQRAPWIAWRRTFSPAEIEEKALSEQWDADFIEAVQGTMGKTIAEYVGTDQQDSSRRREFNDQEEEMKGRIEVFYVYHTAVDAKGVPCKYLTVMSPHLSAIPGTMAEDWPVALDQPLGYDHGLYPFVEHRRERIDRQLISSRGVPEIVMTAQSEVKHMRDARVNQTDLVISPPIIRPEREVGLPLAFRPRGEIGERRMNATRQLSLPNTAPAGEPLEESARRDALDYFGRLRSEDPVKAGLYDQDLADEFCDEEAEVWRHVLKLCQQYEQDFNFTRLVGGEPTRLNLSREEIQGEYDLQLFYNTDTLDPERMQAKAKLFSQFVFPLSQGEIDVAPVMHGLMHAFFPEFADQALRGGEQVTQKEVEDEELNWSRMVGGVEPRMVEEGQNFQLRLQWLQQQVAKPSSQQLMQSLAWMQELVGKRMEHLQFMVQQKTVNAQTGRVGVQAGEEDGS